LIDVVKMFLWCLCYNFRVILYFGVIYLF